jgi:UDP:flavonoid glycosyltransferase YjiC (YdhE family)
LTLGAPEFEWPRTDLRPNVHYFGALRTRETEPLKPKNLPSWWDDVIKAKQEAKKIVALSQGTIEANLNDLLIPTLDALKDRDDVLVIASTVVVEPEGAPELVLPRNARATKFVPYDLLLPLVSQESPLIMMF